MYYMGWGGVSVGGILLKGLTLVLTWLMAGGGGIYGGKLKVSLLVKPLEVLFCDFAPFTKAAK